MRITGSNLDRGLHCPGSESLPHVHSTSWPAWRGTEIHTFLEVARKSYDKAIALVHDEMAKRVCQEIDLTQIPRASAEVPFAYSLSTAVVRRLPKKATRLATYAQLADDEIPCTLDLVGIITDGSGYVGDFKTGWTRVAAAAVNTQLKFGALCVSRVYRVDRVKVELIHVRTDGTLWRDWAFHDAFDLDVFAEEVREACQKAMSGDTTLHAGPWCQWCPAFSHCPEQAALARELGARGFDVRTLTPESAGQVYARVQRAKKLLARIEGAIYGLAARQPIPLPDGRELGEVVTTSNELLDGDIAYNVVRTMHGQDIADAAVKRAATKSGIREALRAVSPRGTLAGNQRAVLEAIRDAGGASKPVKVAVQMYPQGADVVRPQRPALEDTLRASLRVLAGGQ